MHFKGHIITKKIPTEEQLDKILKKYYWESKRRKKEFEWDWYTIGGRFGGQITIAFDPNNNEDNWYAFKDRNNKYFISQAINKLKEANIEYYDELDWLIYMGLRDKTLYVDGGYCNDTIELDITDCYLVIDDEQKIYVRESWNGKDWVTDENYDEKVKQIDLKDKFITVIDFHN